MELISVALVMGFLSHVSFIFIRFWLNIQQKCPFRQKEWTPAKEVRLKSRSCKLYCQTECVWWRTSWILAHSVEAGAVEPRGWIHQWYGDRKNELNWEIQDKMLFKMCHIKKKNKNLFLVNGWSFVSPKINFWTLCWCILVHGCKIWCKKCWYIIFLFHIHFDLRRTN